MNLIKRLRNYMPDGPDGSVHTEAAERIAELESLLDSPPTARAATREARFIKEIAELKKQVTEHESRDSRYWHSIQKRSDGQAERIAELEAAIKEHRDSFIFPEDHTEEDIMLWEHIKEARDE